MSQLDLDLATDAELVSRFAAGRDQRAFAELVKRHGPMVKAVARRQLRHEQDADDAFQATFLALAAAAGRRKWNPTIAAWLHQTALRSARSLGRSNARWKRNFEAKSRVTPEEYTSAVRDDICEVLDETLSRLPAKLRAAIVLCDLEGLGRKEAAARLGVPPSTLANHVADGRKRLRSLLVRRGIGLSAAGVAAHLAELAKAAPLSPAAVGSAATKAALFAAGHTPKEIGVSTTIVHTAQGVLHAMTLTRLSFIAAAALVLVSSAGVIRGGMNMFASVAVAETILIDDFDDGNATGWTEYDLWTTQGSFDAGTGQYQLQGMLRNSGTGSNMFAFWDGSASSRYSNGLLRATVQANTNDTFLALGMRVSGTGPNLLSGYLFGASVGGPFEIYAFRRTGSGGVQVLAQSLPSIQLTSGEDWIFEAGAVGDQLSFKFWRDGEAVPSAPQLAVVDTAFSAGLLGVEANVTGGLGRQGQLGATFDDIQFTTIPEPPTAILSAIFFTGVFAWQWRRSL
jgi:RNA polymerase sigma factor (sigma-70 family)